MYKKEHEDTHVPWHWHYNEDPQLGRWVSNHQQVVYRCKNMREERLRLLNAAGFVIDLFKKRTALQRNEEIWMEMYQRLQFFTKLNTNILMFQ